MANKLREPKKDCIGGKWNRMALTANTLVIANDLAAVECRLHWSDNSARGEFKAQLPD